MLKTIENKLEKFAKISGLTERVTISHGTLYALLVQPERCDFFHNVIRTFYKENINPEGGVNMYAVGDEFAFDFVEGNKDNYVGEKEMSIEEAEKITGGLELWGQFENFTPPHTDKQESDIDIALNLEDEQKRGK